MSVKLVKVNLCTCDLCGHEWVARQVPARCSSCKSWNWNNGGLTRPQLKRAQKVLEDAATRQRAAER